MPSLYAAQKAILSTAITPLFGYRGMPLRRHSLSWATFSGVTGAVTLNPDNDVDDHIHVTIPVSTLVASNKLLTWQLKSDMFLNPSATDHRVRSSSRVVALSAGRFRVFRHADRTKHCPAGDPGGRVERPACAGPRLDATTAISRASYGMDKFALVVDDRIAIAIAIKTNEVPSS